jgi:V/A-type H+-transporting ATPase subunit I
MIFTARMKQLVAVVLDHDLHKVTRELLRQGVMHFIRVAQVAEGIQQKLHSLTPALSQERIAEIRRRIESFLGSIGVAAGSGKSLDVNSLSPVDPEESSRILDRIAATVQGLREKQRGLQQEVLKLEDLRRQVEQFGDLQAGIGGRPYSFLSIQTGGVARSRHQGLIDALNVLPSVLLAQGESEGRVNLLLISMKRDESRVNRILAEHGWTDVEISPEMRGSRQDMLAGLDSRLSALRREQEALDAEVRGHIERERPMLEEMWANLRMNELFYRIQSYFSKTQRTVIFTGWVPATRQRELEKGIREAASGQCYLEWHDPEEADAAERRQVPVEFRNPRILAPFQMLVQNYSLPEYGTIDPTPFVAVAYLAMFGLMFGDAGQGAILALIGLLGGRLYRGAKPGTRNLLALIGWCGLASIVTGVLFGSYFGFRWLPPLWFDFHGAVAGEVEPGGSVQNVYGILLITIYFGIAVIGLGLLLNWVNLAVRRDWFRLAMDKGGILGAWIYGAGVYIAFYFAGHDYRQLPAPDRLFLLVGLPSALLMLKPPLAHFLHRSREARKLTVFILIGFAMEWIVEMLEIYSGYLANTLSFMRVAGLGIAHVSLMTAFFRIAAMIDKGRPGILTVLLLVAGNVLVIGLEGLSAGIQSLRLNYYEFFSKYFQGAGQAYMPVSLRNREA